MRRLLHERAEQDGAAAAGNASDAIRLRAELAHLANRLTGEMAEVPAAVLRPGGCSMLSIA